MDRRYCVRVTPYSLEQDRIERIVDSDVRLVLLDLSETEMVNVPLLDRIIECYDRLRRRGKEFRIKVHDEDIISVFKFLKLSGLLLQHHGGAREKAPEWMPEPETTAETTAETVEPRLST